MIINDKMTIKDKIRDEKLRYNINRKAGKISAWSSWRLINISSIIEQAKFTYSSLDKAFGKHTKTIEMQGRK